jgi:nitrite reductase/ring-hydroxylating ferredoxin subunit
MSTEVSRLVSPVSEIPAGTMKRVTAFNEPILLSKVDGETCAMQNDCGHLTGSWNLRDLEISRGA